MHFIGEAEFAEPGGDFFLLTLTEVGFELQDVLGVSQGDAHLIER